MPHGDEILGLPSFERVTIESAEHRPPETKISRRSRTGPSSERAVLGHIAGTPEPCFITSPSWSFAQSVGLTLNEISADFAKLPKDHAPEEEDWAKLSNYQLDGRPVLSWDRAAESA